VRDQAPTGATRLGENPSLHEAWKQRNAREQTWTIIGAVKSIGDSMRNLLAGGPSPGLCSSPSDLGDFRCTHRVTARRQPSARWTSSLTRRTRQLTITRAAC
jgi:hypothetical protein